MKNLFYNTIEIIPDNKFFFNYDKKKLIIKIGFDPTTENLHLGHLVLLRKLKSLQEMGFLVYIVIGDFTALIGDPSGRNLSRPILNKENIIKNYSNYIDQIKKFLIFEKTFVYFNSSWFNNFDFNNLMNIMLSTTVNRMLERSDFKIRFSTNKSICIHEFIYPLFQAYDSVFLNSDIEIGGIDQKFNFLLSRELQKKFFQREQTCLMMPILIGIDGKNKMSKSLNNSINLTDDFYDIFCKTMSIPDFLIDDYFINLSLLCEKKLFALKLIYKNPMDLKLHLSHNIVEIIYNLDKADIAKSMFIDFFSKKTFSSDLEVKNIYIDKEKISIYYILSKLNLINSYSEFKRFLKFGSIKLNNKVILDKNFELKVNILYFLKFGKKKFLKIFLIKQ
jgi:tyrosyl-tRNA synthetase